MKYVLSLSGGKDSMAMFLLVLEKQYPLDYVIFCDTGMEFDSIYRNIDLAESMCNKLDIPFRRLTLARPFMYDMVEKPINARDGSIKYGRGWCGGSCRWGTAEKRGAINRFYKTIGEPVVEYVGIAADEQSRINHQRSGDTVKLFPLAEWGMTELDCLQYCYEHDINWVEDGIELYAILDRVSCWCCAYKNKKELRNIYRFLPRYWSKLKELQNQIIFPFKAYGSIFDLEKEFESEE